MTAEQIAKLRRENERLRQRIEDLEELCGIDLKSRVDLKCSKRIGMILGLLLKRELVTSDMINIAFGRDDDFYLDPRVLNVYVSRTRKLLAKWGIALKNDWGCGWYVEKKFKAVLRANLMGEEAKAA